MNRHERRKAAKGRREIIDTARPLPRLMRFLDALSAAPGDADIEIRQGQTEDGAPAILVSISGHGDHPMMVDEARKVADILEESMRKFPDSPEAAELPNMIMGLREAATRATQS